MGFWDSSSGKRKSSRPLSMSVGVPDPRGEVQTRRSPAFPRVSELSSPPAMRMLALKRLSRAVTRSPMLAPQLKP